MKTQIHKKFCQALAGLLFLAGFSILKAQYPVADFTFTVHANGSVDFTSVSTNTPANVSCNWNFGDGASTNSVQSTSHTYTAAGYYAALLTIWTPAGVLLDSVYKSIPVTAIAAGIHENEITSRDLLVYPNPVNSMLHISADLPGTSAAKARISDLSGKEITFIPELTGGGMQLDLSQYATGTYVLQVVSGQSVVTRKIVIARE